MQKFLASMEGIYAEAASVTSLVTVSKLKKADKIDRTNTVVTVIKSTGLKDPAETAKLYPKVTVIKPELEELSLILKEDYGFLI